MTIHTTPETEQAVNQLVATGFGGNPDEVIRRLVLEKLVGRDYELEAPRELPFEKAALFLHVSGERLQAMLEDGGLSYRQVGNLRLIPMEELKILQTEIKVERHRLQDQTVAIEQELGIYE